MSEDLLALYEALRDDPFYRTMERAYSGAGSADDAMLRYYDLSVKEAETWGRVGRAPHVNGLSVWSVPLSGGQAQKKAAEKKTAMARAMGNDCAELYLRIASSMADSEATLPLENMWYLSILGVSPAQQGQGLGRALLDPVFREADAAGVASYLTTFTPRNIPFYERQGYEQVVRFDEPVVGAPFTVLIRPSKG